MKKGQKVIIKNDSVFIGKSGIITDIRYRKLYSGTIELLTVKFPDGKQESSIFSNNVELK